MTLPSLTNKLIVAISSRALFDFEAENKVFEQGDDREYMKLQRDLLDEPAKPGVAYSLIKKLLAFPGEVAEAAARRAPHRITVYALELAQDFTAFYEHCRVIGVTPSALESQRVALSAATQRTIALALGLLGVSAPDSM